MLSYYAKSLVKTSIVLIVCMAFVGQAIASTIMSYQMLSMMNMMNMSSALNTELASDSAPQNMMSMMDHSMHDMSGNSSDMSLNTSGSDESSSQDCCNNNCQCYTGGCSNVATIMNNVAPNLTMVNSDKIRNISSVVLSQQTTSLYRPPIIS